MSARSRRAVLRASLCVSVSLGAALGCSSKERVEAVGERRSEAKTLGIFSPDLAEDIREQTLATLERDAFRREQRFLEATSPGRMFRSTAVPQAEIDAGLWSARELFQLGAQLFNVTFTPDIGYGGKDLPPLSRFHKGRRGGPDARRCSTCHWRGGPAGAGDGADNAYLDGDGDSQASALERNPISLSGAGLVEILASEMSRDLQEQEAALIKAAKRSGADARGELKTKGVSFGFITARPEGSIDTIELRGVDDDLVVRPFGWKGNLTSIRAAVEDALLVHHGMQSTYLAKNAENDRVGPFPRPDPDGDGKTDEITEGQVTALTLFLAMQEVPQITLPLNSDFVLLWSKGRAQFEELGCAVCHIPSMPLESTRFVLDSRDGGGKLTVDLATEGAEPRIKPQADGGGYSLNLFSDLKRHDMGAGLREGHNDRGMPSYLFLTRPLWGVARSRPYLHDARAQELDAAILLHGGEAQTSRDAFEALPVMERQPLIVYLTSLTRARRMISP